jgi:hypothetical protein
VGQLHMLYLGGPHDGHRATLPAADPPTHQAVPTPPRWDSWLDPQPAVPAELHHYVLVGTEHHADGLLARYTHRGQIHL